MNIPVYPVIRVPDKLTFYFLSLDPFGRNPVLKIVTYSIYDKHSVTYYNLGFGDFNPESNEVNDTAVSNNGDMRKILVTVVSTLKMFFEEKPYDSVHVVGSDQRRQAYYQKLIADYSNLIDGVYLVKGGYSEKIEPFHKAKNYEFLLISLAEPIPLLQEPEEIYVMDNLKKSIQEQEIEKKFLKFMSTRTTEDVFPEKNRKAWENLKRARL